MSLFDRFRSKKGKEEKRKHVATPKKGAVDADKEQFKNVPSAGRDGAAQSKERVSADRDEKIPDTKEKHTKPDVTGNAYRVLERPLVTEKSSMFAEHGQYVFAVNITANKVEVADAVEKVYGVRPIRVRMQVLQGKQVRYGRNSGSTKAWKKAVVTLPKGKTIDVFEA